MDIEVLENKVCSLTEQQQASVASYIDFLIFQNENEIKTEKKPLNFHKFDTSTHIWQEDAQLFVNRMRSHDRF